MEEQKEKIVSPGQDRLRQAGKKADYAGRFVRT
jgi:hypothetical protein